MTVNVKGRNIRIDDKLAEKYEEMGFEPIDELFVLASVGGNVWATYRKTTSEMFPKLTDFDIQKIVENRITEILEKPYLRSNDLGRHTYDNKCKG